MSVDVAWEEGYRTADRLNRQRVDMSRAAEYRERSYALEAERILHDITEAVFDVDDDWHCENIVRPRLLRALGFHGPFWRESPQ